MKAYRWRIETGGDFCGGQGASCSCKFSRLCDVDYVARGWYGRSFAAITTTTNMNLLSNWHFMRILRALVAVWAIFEFINTKEWMVLFIGGFFAVQAIFDVGCCGASGCATAPQTRKQDGLATQEVDYEEVK